MGHMNPSNRTACNLSSSADGSFHLSVTPGKTSSPSSVSPWCWRLHQSLNKYRIRDIRRPAASECCGSPASAASATVHLIVTSLLPACQGMNDSLGSKLVAKRHHVECGMSHVFSYITRWIRSWRPLCPFRPFLHFLPFPSSSLFLSSHTLFSVLLFQRCALLGFVKGLTRHYAAFEKTVSTA
ncbi:hypothetical protein EI94DRAFT_1138797 [Lactarius quietus]|nr:hypothetical protein EI94DRAFT_1138797 [Lactarius quietus]